LVGRSEEEQAVTSSQDPPRTTTRFEGLWKEDGTAHDHAPPGATFRAEMQRAFPSPFRTPDDPLAQGIGEAIARLDQPEPERLGPASLGRDPALRIDVEEVEESGPGPAAGRRPGGGSSLGPPGTVSRTGARTGHGQVLVTYGGSPPAPTATPVPTPTRVATLTPQAILTPIAPPAAAPLPTATATTASTATAVPPTATATATATAATAAPPGPATARDGQHLGLQPASVQAAFQAIHGDGAAARWVAEHEAALARTAP
jgi:hypothetical protein